MAAPKLIHRYEIVERLGRGGMGDLYLGRDPLLGRPVAIKVLRAGLDDDELRERFAREAKSAARLQHVNIVTIYDVGEYEGLPYIAMEYVHGETLFQVIQRKPPLDLATRLQYIDELCAGLAHAHRAGIVHRDIKPANLILSADGTLKILDFGIARPTDSKMTRAGMIIGTLNYMSPEQVAGGPIDPRSDVFSVGAVFYELLAYQQAFPGGIDSGVLSRIIDANYPPLAPIANRIDDALARMIGRTLARNPADRYPDLAVLREEIARARLRLDPRPLDAAEINEKTVAIDRPTPNPVTPRKGIDRSQIQRRRQEEVQTYLTAAREASAAGRHEEAAAACERVLIIDPENHEAHAISEQSRAAVEQQQVHEWMSEAGAEFERGNLERAGNLVSLVLSIDADSPEALTLRAAIDRTRRCRLFDEAVGEAQAALDSDDLAAAEMAVERADRISPADREALAVRGAIEARREELAAKAKADEDARRLAEEQQRRQRAEEVQRRADEARRLEAARQAAAEQARQEAEAKAEAERQARREVEEAARQAAAEQAGREAEAKAEAERQAQREGEEAQRFADDAHQRMQIAEAAPVADDAGRDREAEAHEDDGAPLAPTVFVTQPFTGHPSSGDAIPSSPSEVSGLPDTLAPGEGHRTTRRRSRRIALLAAAALLAVASGGAWWAIGTRTASTPATRSAPARTELAPPAPAPVAPVVPPAPVVTGTLIVDAAPWAEIVEITGVTGRVPATVSYTPVAMSVPEGEYQVILRNPSDRASRTVTVRVTAATPARAFAEFAPVDVGAYFKRAGS